MNAPKNLLIVRTDRIGDVILSLPLAEIVKKHFHNCHVSFLLRKYSYSLAKENPFINEIILLKQKNHSPAFFKNILLLRNKKFDTCIIVYPTFILALIIFFAGIKNRIGTGYRWYSFLFNKRIYEHRKTAEYHELVYNINLLKPIGINEQVEFDKVDFNIKSDPESKNIVEEFFHKSLIENDKPIVIIHPGSGGSAIDLPIEKFIELISYLSELDIQILITGSKDEIDKCNKLMINNEIKNFAGKFNLSELIALIDKCVLFISNSTGPLHIAVGLQKFVIGFFPKIKQCSVERWGPFTNKRLIFAPTINCSDCTKEQCLKLNCMNSISMDGVFANIQKIFNFPKRTEKFNAKNF